MLIELFNLLCQKAIFQAFIPIKYTKIKINSGVDLPLEKTLSNIY